jgi:hypothetical protein
VRGWQDLRMGKRAGRGNAKSGMSGTEAGELAVPCVVCPIPGVNMPEGWQNLPKELRFVRAERLFI